MADNRRDGGDRARDRPRDSRDRHDPKDSRRGGPPEGRDRSRSPRDRGDRRGNYRARSPPGRDDGRGRDRRDRGDRRYDNDRDQRESRSNREPPKGPRRATTGPRRDGGSGPATKQEPGVATRPDPGSQAASVPVQAKDVKMEEPERQRPQGMDDETWEMAQVMGFARFNSTKGKKVPGNDRNFAVRKDKKMEARQYMNRQGGFNRPLSPSRGS